MKGIVLSFLVPFVRRFLIKITINVGQNLWDATWNMIFYAIERAEEKWKKGGRGKEKKKWFINEVLSFIEWRVRLSNLKRKLLEIFLSQIADAVVNILNEELGHQWIHAIESLESHLRSRISFLQ